ncbi:DUF1016 N-terminal domain-containing protein [Streptomyces sp. SID13031]|uniref:DUF1016 N-terminal domain-containing protein n=1 Tax=Streptomyces sp. SID13031 TaxID=2706046 RepID=UPI0013CBFEF0|nr:DUF1016 N-terminal domain-containing protein [Streptomyces sp. SID13031]NEA30867.1 DUF1016 domain-containing protein [Streptomyces sp. SID13031]
MNVIPTDRPSMPDWYPAFLEAVATHVAADNNTVLTNWSIGQEILRWQPSSDWSSRAIDHLSTDLTARFPTRKGLSARNLRYMITFAESWPLEAYARGPLARLPWYHHLTLIQKLTNRTHRLWYARESIDNKWTHATLKAHIANNFYRTQHLRTPPKSKKKKTT